MNPGVPCDHPAEAPTTFPQPPIGTIVADDNSEGNVIIECACGAVIRGNSERELLDAARRHIEARHRELGGPPPDEDLLAMAFEELPAADGISQHPQPAHSTRRSTPHVES